MIFIGSEYFIKGYRKGWLCRLVGEYVFVMFRILGLIFKIVGDMRRGKIEGNVVVRS